MNAIKIITIALLLSACSPNENSQIQDAKKALQEGDDKRAQVIAKSLLQKNAQDTEARGVLAKAQFMKGAFPDAQSNFDKAYELGDKRFVNELIASAVLNEAYDYALKLFSDNSDLNAMADAFALYAALTQNNPELVSEIQKKLDTGSYDSLSQSFLSAKNGQISQALQYAEKAAFEDPNNADAYWFQGVYQHRLFKPDEALAAFEYYRELRPNDARSIYFIARSAVAAGDWKLAKTYGQKLTEIVESHSYGNYILGVTALQEGKVAQAYRNATRANVAQEVELQAKLLRGVSAYEMGNFESAFNDLLSVSIRTSSNSAATAFALLTALKLNDGNSLTRIIDEVFDGGEEIDIASTVSGITYSLAKQGDEQYLASLLFDSLKRVYPDNFYSVTVQNLLSSKLNKEASMSLEELLALDGDNERVLIALMYQNLRENNTEVAKRYVDSIKDESVKGHIKVNIALLEQRFKDAYELTIDLIESGRGSNATLNLAINAAEKLETKPDHSRLEAVALQNNLNIFPLKVVSYLNAKSEENKKWLRRQLSQQEIGLKAFFSERFIREEAYGDALDIIPAAYTHSLEDPVTKLKITSLLAVGSTPKLVAFFEEWSLNADSTAPMESVVRLLLGEKKFSQIIDTIEPLSISGKASQTMERGLVRAYIFENEIDKAKALLNSLIEKNPFDGELFYELSRLEGKGGNISRQRALLEKAYTIEPSEKIVINYAYHFLQHSLTGKAVKLLEEHGVENPNHDNAKLLYAMVSVADEPQKALEAYLSVPKTILYKSPDSLNNVAYLLAQKGQFEEAKKYLNIALQADPDNSAYLDTKELIDKNR